MNIHPRRVDDGGRDLSHGLEQQALEPDALAHRQIAPQGVRAPRLPKAASQGAVRSLEKDERLPEVVARQALVHRRQLAEGFSPADVYHNGSAFDAAAGLAVQLRKFGNQIDRQVIHTVETQVLERLQRRTLARSAEPGDQHKLAQGLLRNCADAFHRSSGE